MVVTSFYHAEFPRFDPGRKRVFNECTLGMVGSYLGGAVVLCGGVVVDRDGRASIDRPNKGARETEEERRRPPEETTPCYVLKSEGRNSSI